MAAGFRSTTPRKLGRFGSWLAVVALGVGSARCVSEDSPESCHTPPTEIYEQRIEPLLLDDNPKTCNQCHLSGVDLSAFVRSTPCETMACLVADGLVDPSKPSESKILGWIRRAQPDSALITERVIDAEYDGFLQWIEASAGCPSACEGAVCGAPTARSGCRVEPDPAEPPVPDTGDPDCNARALEQQFLDDVYAFRGRCFPCHFDNELDEDPSIPRWISTRGNCGNGSIETLRLATEAGYLDLEEPEQSLLLLKPLTEFSGGVPHGGGQKFEGEEDPAYQSFLSFIRSYARCQSDAPRP
jgi:hypothetical protein